MKKLKASNVIILFTLIGSVSSQSANDAEVATTDISDPKSSISATITSKEGDKTTTLNTKSEHEESTTNKTVTAKKNKKLAKRATSKQARRAIRKPKYRLHATTPAPGVLEALMGSKKYINRWFVDMYKNKYPISTVVINFYSSRKIERAYINLCPSHHRVRFHVKAQLGFAIYFMPETFSEKDMDVWDKDNNRIPEQTFRITVGKSFDVDIDDLIIRVKSWPAVGPYSNYPSASYHKLFQTMDYRAFQSYWLWWDQHGLIVMGRDGEPPFLTHFQPFNWNPRFLGFSNSFRAYPAVESDNPVTYVVEMEYPHFDKVCDCKVIE